MASIPVIHTSSEFREEFFARGGENAARCYQCATCSSVCELAPANAPFPRRQILWAQWGLADRLIADPGPWLCHQCNDCSVRCPREVNPGDMMAVARAMVVEKLATPAFLGRLVGNVKKTWPILIFGPLLFWIILLGVTGATFPGVNHDLGALDGRFHYEAFVPHSLIYITYFSATIFVLLTLGTSGRRFWKLLGTSQERHGSFFGALVPALIDIGTHKKFSTCDRGIPKRRWGHFLVMWGFVGAAVTSGFAILYLYRETVFFSWLHLGYDYPVPLTRTTGDKLVGMTTAFDRFFLWVVLGVIATGVLTEIFRFVAVPPMVACSIYVVHLGIVLTLFLTLPYSKFAHILYRTLAMAHERMTTHEG
ncbi:MAG: 4Fe-4S dicluster domain-containing protein [Acidobacteriota bacterium]